MIKKLVVSVACLSMLTACETLENAEGIGTAVGAVAGGIIGNQVADENKELWTLAGVAAGAFIGNQIGKYLDKQDEEKVAGATVSAAESGEPQTWKNADTGASGTASVVKDTSSDNCKEIKQTVSTADGNTAEEVVKACKGADGAWTVVSA